MNTIGTLLAAASLALALPALAQDTPADPGALITGARIFDGIGPDLIDGQDVLIQDGMIVAIGADLTVPEGATVIDAGGRTMTPGLIYMHEHLMMAAASAPQLLFADERYRTILAATTARGYLEAGITSVRDAAGNTYGLKAAIDEDLTPGPRIYPSGPMISQTSGHADHRYPGETTLAQGGPMDRLVREGDMAIADGEPEVLKIVREQLRRGSSQIKIAVGGGTGSVADPLEVLEYRDDEIRAAVDAASDFGTYVLAHVYNSDGIRRAVKNGVRSIEHANLTDTDTLQYMMDNDVWLSPQVKVYTFIPQGYTPGQAEKHRSAYAGLDAMFTAANAIGFENIVFGSDIISSASEIDTISDEFDFRSQWFSPLQIMRQATSNGGELLALSGPLNPYPQGKPGVIAEGAYADLLLVDGNPLEDISVMTTPDETYDLIMKDGKVYKNAL
ncbi:metal-dependent hydrolase family protein [Pseudoruegeria sp. SHC-113]|uniref:metal-dependent hydrolase family protein n=1 Tax=Pseudoruegeria sp. SHC-113 TaxID=2855439 RepID=UPI0021BA59EC|nr:amidohydrolase family protein [Pseudoruegeria sp. SHC-113]MCT8161475.1 amidohydrolase family protein [Pseudoruegeria sp. SHC-113]